MSVRVVERTFDILDALARSPNGLGVSDVSRQIDLPKSTVSRLLLTLEALSVGGQPLSAACPLQFITEGEARHGQ